ncbi:MAG: hypothetical protein EOP04_23285, partial [Proteobacteria bacterium]
MTIKDFLSAVIRWLKSQWGILFILPLCLSIYSIWQSDLSIERNKSVTISEWCSSNAENLEKSANRFSVNYDGGDLGRQDFLQNLRDELILNLGQLRNGGLRGSEEQLIIARAVTVFA